MSKTGTEYTFLRLTVLVLVSISLSGCFVFDIGGSYTLRASWHQPELWDMFPQENESGKFHIFTENATFTGGRVATRQGGPFSGWSSMSIGVTEWGRAGFTYADRPPSFSSDAAWKHLLKGFEELGLPEPTLDPSFEFAQVVWYNYAVWHQPGLWEKFPQDGVLDGYQVFVHEDLKVAQWIDRTTSASVRVTEDGNVSFRYELRWVKGTSYPEPDGSRPTPYERWTREEMLPRLAEAFEILGLPEPTLDPERDIRNDRWVQGWIHDPDWRGPNGGNETGGS